MMIKEVKMNDFFRKTGRFLWLFLLMLVLPPENAFLLPLVQLIQPTTTLAAEPAGPAWKDKWNETLAAAKKEGAVMLYTSSGVAVRQALVPKAKELFGLNMDVIVAKSDELTQKIMTERQRSLYYADVFIAGTQIIMSPLSGILSPLHDSLILPEATDPKAWPNGQLPFLDKNRLGLSLTGAYWSYILVNTDMVKEGELKSYADLVNPKWKGKMIMFDPSGGGAAVYWVNFVLKVMGQEKGEKFLRQLATQQDLVLTKDARLQGEWVARGKYPIAIAPSMGAVTPLLKAGAPIAWVRVREGGLVHPSGSVFAFVDKRPHPNAAKVILNWLLTADGQQLFSKAFGQPATRLGIPTEGIDPFTVPKADEKVYRLDEKFIADVETNGREFGRKYFGHLLQ